jgi:hypothetical protein
MRLRYLVALLTVTALSVVSTPVANTASASQAVSCNGAISWSKARAYAGTVTTVKGRVVETYYATSSGGQPTFLDLGVGYPDARRFTAIIWRKDRAKFGSPERRYYGKTICVRGLITMYDGRAEISVRSPSQIRVA